MKQAENNSTHSLANHELRALIHDNGDDTSTKIEADATGGGITHSKVDNSDGLDIDDEGSINERLADTLGSDESYHDVKLRETGVCIQGTRKLAIVKMSEPYDPPD